MHSCVKAVFEKIEIAVFKKEELLKEFQNVFNHLQKLLVWALMIWNASFFFFLCSLWLTVWVKRWPQLSQLEKWWKFQGLRHVGSNRRRSGCWHCWTFAVWLVSLYSHPEPRHYVWDWDSQIFGATWPYFLHYCERVHLHLFGPQNRYWHCCCTILNNHCNSHLRGIQNSNYRTVDHCSNCNLGGSSSNSRLLNRFRILWSVLSLLVGALAEPCHAPSHWPEQKSSFTKFQLEEKRSRKMTLHWDRLALQFIL